MKQTMNPVNIRIEWCQRQSAQARTEPEVDGWRAEADGLRDALMDSDHTDNYRLCPPAIFERYVLGFQDGTALLRAARVGHPIHAAITATPQFSPLMERDILPGDDR